MAEIIIKLNINDIREAILNYISESCNIEGDLKMEGLTIEGYDGKKIEKGNIEEIVAVYVHVHKK